MVNNLKAIPVKKDLTLGKNTRAFSLKERIKSLGHAFDGISAFFSSQHNAVIHFAATIFAFAAALFFNASKLEVISIVIVTGFVGRPNCLIRPLKN